MFMGVDSKLFDWICWLRCVTFIFRRFVGCSMHLVSPVTGSKPCFGQESGANPPCWAMFKCPSQQSVGRSMFMKVGKKWFGWLAALAPVVGWGQPRIITNPENATVCVGEVAEFISEVNGQLYSWQFNDTIQWRNTS